MVIYSLIKPIECKKKISLTTMHDDLGKYRSQNLLQSL